MPRRPAAITQADVARALRAAKQVGAASVEVKPDGTIHILLSPETGQQQVADAPPIDREREIVL